MSPNLSTDSLPLEPPMQRLWACNDGNSDDIILAETRREAAELYVSEGVWPTASRTTWHVVLVIDSGDDDDNGESVRITVEPIEPACTDEDGHDWGEWWNRAHGGGVLTGETCSHCGLERTYDSWGQCPETGEQGLATVEYSSPEDEDEDEDESARQEGSRWHEDYNPGEDQ